MSRPSEFPHTSGATVCIVTGGHKKKPDPGQSNKLQATDPLRHGNNINSTQYPFVPIMTGCTQDDLETNAPPPEPGSTILMLPATGDPSSRMAAFVIKDQNKSGSSSGNYDLSKLKNFVTAVGENVEKVVSKGFSTSTRDGAEVRKPKDGDNWKHDLTRGLPTHAATYPLGGTVLPNRQKIETAIQQFAGILSPSMVSQMPGSFMSMGDLLSSLTKSQKKQIQDAMPVDVYQAFESTSNLMQSGEASSFSTGGRVNPEVFIANAIDLLTQVTNPADLDNVFHRLQYDTDLFGLDELEAVSMEVEGAFGTFTQKIDANGNITDEIPEVVQQLIEQFAQMLSSSSSAPGGGKGENLFGEAAQTMTDMLGRVEPTVQKFRQQMLSELNTSMEAEKFKEILKLAAWDGGNPLSMIG
jgi:hypothetical protein